MKLLNWIAAACLLGTTIAHGQVIEMSTDIIEDNGEQMQNHEFLDRRRNLRWIPAHPS